MAPGEAPCFCKRKQSDKTLSAGYLQSLENKVTPSHLVVKASVSFFHLPCISLAQKRGWEWRADPGGVGRGTGVLASFLLPPGTIVWGLFCASPHWITAKPFKAEVVISAWHLPCCSESINLTLGTGSYPVWGWLCWLRCKDQRGLASAPRPHSSCHWLPGLSSRQGSSLHSFTPATVGAHSRCWSHSRDSVRWTAASCTWLSLSSSQRNLVQRLPFSERWPYKESPEPSFTVL